MDQPANKMEEDCRNGYLAGLIAYCRMADHMKDDESRQKGVKAARAALRRAIGLRIRVYPRWPYLGSAGFAQHLRPVAASDAGDRAFPGRITSERPTGSLMDVYVDYHRPTWYLAWGVETLWRNESPFAFPTMPAEIFAARAWILGEPAEKLVLFLDIPWCKADLFYLQKLVLCLEAP